MILHSIYLKYIYIQIFSIRNSQNQSELHPWFPSAFSFKNISIEWVNNFWLIFVAPMKNWTFLFHQKKKKWFLFYTFFSLSSWQEEEKASNLLKDKRFESMFTDPNFQIDRESSEYHLINPLVSKLDRVKAKKERQRQIVQKQFEPVKVKQNFYDYSQWNFFFFYTFHFLLGLLTSTLTIFLCIVLLSSLINKLSFL